MRRSLLRRVANRSMVLAQVQGVTRVVPGRPGSENHPSQYCESLSKWTANYPRSHSQATRNRRFPGGDLAYLCRTTGDQLAGGYPLPIRYLSTTYPVPIPHLTNLGRMRGNDASLGSWGGGKKQGRKLKVES